MKKFMRWLFFGLAPGFVLAAYLKARGQLVATALCAVLFLSGCADTRNLKNMSAREIQDSINTPLYAEGTVERAWENAFWDEKLSYNVRNSISDVLDEYNDGKLTSKEALNRIAAIRR